jgi:hypothetical protein
MQIVVEDFITAIRVQMRAIEMEAMFQFRKYVSLQYKLIMLLKCTYIYLVHIGLVRIYVVFRIYLHCNLNLHKP